MSDPLMNYYMMGVLGAICNLPQGFVVAMPEPMPIYLLLASIGQYQLVGLLVYTLD